VPQDLVLLVLLVHKAIQVEPQVQQVLLANEVLQVPLV
jgi:hypothetical protein